VDTPAFVPGFAEDIFISYGHIDNASGWVDALHNRLVERVPEVLGTPVRIWRDRKLDGADALWEVIEERLSQTALCLSVVTPRYVTSPSCTREALRFLQFAERNGGVKVGDMVRLIRVKKTPYAANAEPPEMVAIETLGFQFFRMDPQGSSTFEEFAAQPGLPGYEDFYTTSEKLAQTLAKLLKRMCDARAKDAQAAPAKSAFVAYTGSDRKLDRDTVVNTLRSNGFRVVPGEDRPDAASELISYVNAHSQEWDVAVHILGCRAGGVLEEDPRTIVKLQYDLVRAATVKPEFKQLVWIPELRAEPEPPQRAFLDELQTVGDEKTEVLRTGLARLIDTVTDLLKKKPPAKRLDRAVSVFLMCTRDDLEHPDFKAIRKYFQDNGIYYDEPAFDGDAATIEQLRNEYIASADATLIYYGAAPDSWVQMMRMVLRKTLAPNPNREKYVRAVYLCTPPDLLKKNKYLDLSAHALPEPGFPPLLVLGDCEGFADTKLQPLFEQLSKGAA
jgi:TIR domain